jgi:hypothetical protein
MRSQNVVTRFVLRARALLDWGGPSLLGRVLVKSPLRERRELLGEEELLLVRCLPLQTPLPKISLEAERSSSWLF